MLLASSSLLLSRPLRRPERVSLANKAGRRPFVERPYSHNERRLNREYWSETSPSIKEWRLQVNLYFPIGGAAPANAKRKRADRAHPPSLRPTRCRGPEVRSTAGDRGRRRGPPPLWPRRLRVNLRCVPRKCSFPCRRTSI